MWLWLGPLSHCLTPQHGGQCWGQAVVGSGQTGAPVLQSSALYLLFILMLPGKSLNHERSLRFLPAQWEAAATCHGSAWARGEEAGGALELCSGLSHGFVRARCQWSSLESSSSTGWACTRVPAWEGEGDLPPPSSAPHGSPGRSARQLPVPQTRLLSLRKGSSFRRDGRASRPQSPWLPTQGIAQPCCQCCTSWVPSPPSGGNSHSGSQIPWKQRSMRSK